MQSSVAFALGTAAGATILWLHQRQSRLRKQAYDPSALDPPSLPANPIILLKKWLAANQATDGISARFMVLATSSASEGAPAAHRC